VVWTHRSPVECVASSCSLYEAILQLTVDAWTIDKATLGKAVLRYTKLCLDRALASLEKNKAMKVRAPRRDHPLPVPCDERLRHGRSRAQRAQE